MNDETFLDRLMRISSEVELAENFLIVIGRDPGLFDAQGDPAGRYYYQIECWRKDVITGEMGLGYGGKAYLDPGSTDSQLVQTIFGLYKGYWEHEARETFQWKGRRVFGPHISTVALWEIAPRVDVRSAQHVEDRSPNGLG